MGVTYPDELRRGLPRPDRQRPPKRTHRKPRTIPWPWDDRGRSALTRADVVEGIRQADVIAPVPWG